MHDVAVLLAEKDPAAQSVHACERLALANFPRSHGEQAEARELEEKPGSQSTHAEALASLKVPAPQLMQSVAAAPLNSPPLHETHLEAPVLPVYVPFAQPSQLVLLMLA